MYLEKSGKLKSIGEPFGVRIRLEFNQQQKLEMRAIGKPIKMNDFLSSFEDKLGQPVFVEQTVAIASSILCPVPLSNLPFPAPLLHFARDQLKVPLPSVLSVLSDMVCLLLTMINSRCW